MSVHIRAALLFLLLISIFIKDSSIDILIITFTIALIVSIVGAIYFYLFYKDEFIEDAGEDNNLLTYDNIIRIVSKLLLLCIIFIFKDVCIDKATIAFVGIYILAYELIFGFKTYYYVDLFKLLPVLIIGTIISYGLVFTRNHIKDYLLK